MKILDDKMLNEFKQKSIIEDDEDSENILLSESSESKFNIHEYDVYKTKVLKYVCYKKRSEHEIKNKFANIIETSMLDSIITNLKENGYIDDVNYIKRAVNEYMAINNLSIKEIRYKLYSKGINNNLIDNYISNNIEILNAYELESAKKIILKKSNQDINQLRAFLLKKGYRSESIKEALK